MAIIRAAEETIISSGTMGTGFELSELVKQSREMSTKWRDFEVDNTNVRNFDITPEMKFIYNTARGERIESDISEYAFSQMCARLGINGQYIRKCVEAGKTELALQNFHAWADECRGGLLVREYDGIARAVLSEEYSLFDNTNVLKTLNNTVDTEKFKATQVHLSSDRLTVRFVDYTPLPIDDRTNVYAGFTVNSSDVGRGSLNMKYFLYRLACTNGLVVSELGGTMFRQHHAGVKMTENKISLFNQAFMDVNKLTKQAVELIRENKGRTLKDYEIAMYVEKAKREMKLSNVGTEKLESLISAYGNDRWGVINAVTELAQDYTLDTRIDMESWAGNMLTASVK